MAYDVTHINSLVNVRTWFDLLNDYAPHAIKMKRTVLPVALAERFCNIASHCRLCRDPRLSAFNRG